MRIPLRSVSRPRRRQGAAAAEFAIALPLLVLLVLGCVDFGRFAYNYIAVTNAARAGAAFGIMNPYLPSGEAAWRAQILQKARDEMAGQTDYTSSDLTATTTVTLDPNGIRRVRVECTCPFQTIVPWPALPSTITLRRAVVMPSIR